MHGEAGQLAYVQLTRLIMTIFLNHTEYRQGFRLFVKFLGPFR